MYALELKACLVPPVFMERGISEVAWQRLVDVVQARKRRDSKSLGVASSRDIRVLEEAHSDSGAKKYENRFNSSVVTTIKQFHVHFQLFF